jgi:hypothetical protein
MFLYKENTTCYHLNVRYFCLMADLAFLKEAHLIRGLFAFKSICVHSAYILLSVIAEYLKCTETVDMPRTTYAQSNSAAGTLA